MSGGEWQKIAIARGFYRKRDLIVLDEPTAAIDPNEWGLLQNGEYSKMYASQKQWYKY